MLVTKQIVAVSGIPWVNIRVSGTITPVVQPALVLSLRSRLVVAAGRLTDMRDLLEDAQEAYRRGGHFDLADALVLLAMPHNQGVVDRLVGVPGAAYDFYTALCDCAGKEG